MAKLLKCPQCEQIDKVEKVSAIVASGTSRSSHSGPTVGGSVGVGLSGRTGVGIGGGYAYTTLSGGVQTDLAARLSPPAKPKEEPTIWEPAVVGMVSGIISILVIALLAEGVPGLVGDTLVEIALVLAAIGIGVLMSRWKWRMKKREEEEYTKKIKKWEEEIARWEKFYYCARCDVIFIP